MSCFSYSYRFLKTAPTLVLLWAAYSQSTFAETRFPGDFFVFPDFKLSNQSGSGLEPNAKQTDIEPAIDIFYSYQKDNLMFLVEYYVNHTENEFERLQLGYAVNKNNRFWLGRFHNPLAAWNTDFHHGIYLQTTISRPAITDFEDNNGILPTHVSGLLHEYDYYFGGSHINTNLALGAGASMESGSLEPFNIFNPGDETYQENITLRLKYYPETSENTFYGIFTGYSRMKGDSISSDEIKQLQVGIFTVLQLQDFLIRSTLFYIDNRLDFISATPGKKGSFFNGYVQMEYPFDERWTGFARLENTFGDDNDPYLALFPTFAKQREVAGVRVGLFTQQALTFELRQDHITRGTINYAVLQWSMYLP